MHFQVFADEEDCLGPGSDFVPGASSPHFLILLPQFTLSLSFLYSPWFSSSPTHLPHPSLIKVPHFRDLNFSELNFKDMVSRELNLFHQRTRRLKNELDGSERGHGRKILRIRRKKNDEHSRHLLPARSSFSTYLKYGAYIPHHILSFALTFKNKSP